MVKKIILGVLVMSFLSAPLLRADDEPEQPPVNAEQPVQSEGGTIAQ